MRQSAAAGAGLARRPHGMAAREAGAPPRPEDMINREADDRWWPPVVPCPKAPALKRQDNSNDRRLPAPNARGPGPARRPRSQARRGDTAGRYTLIDRHGPPGGGPPPHRDDFEGMFGVLDGEIELTFRGQTSTARTGDTVNIQPPRRTSFATQAIARHGCSACAPPAGQQDFFREIGVPLARRTQAPPPLDADAETAFVARALALAPKYRTQPPLGPSET
jgi:hypothetical protein